MKIISDSANWSLDDDAKCLRYHFYNWSVLSRSRFTFPRPRLYFVSRDALFKKPYNFLRLGIPYAIDFYHGNIFSDSTYLKYLHLFASESIKRRKRFLIRVSNKKMYNLLLDSSLNIPIHMIPIPVDTSCFHPQSFSHRNTLRHHIGASSDSFVIGSFQKDGIGWQNGMSPKLVKGPDIFLSTLSHLKHCSTRPLFVLLTGPSRGYIKEGLRSLGIPFYHNYLNSSAELSSFYSALDVYCVTSRDEGGPKAILESMACGIPIVTTSVGQAPDIIEHGVNGILCPPIPSIISSELLKIQVSNNALMISNGLKTSASFNYTNNQPLWDRLFYQLYSF